MTSSTADQQHGRGSRVRPRRGPKAWVLAAGDGFPALGPGMNDAVNALTVFNGALIAGGYFTAAGGTSANYIAASDGSTWSPLGSGMNDWVNALTVFDRTLIAGGRFTVAGSLVSA